MLRYRPFVMVLLIFGTICICLAQETVPSLQQEIETLKQGQEAIHKELQAIRALLLQKTQTPTAPTVNVKGIEFELGDGPILGNNMAKLTLVDITDYQCPYCGRYARETLPQILKQYVDNGKIRYAIVDLPLPMHQLAQKAAEASYCAADQGKYWQMHDQMMAKQELLNNLSSYAPMLGLDISKFEDCLKANKHEEKVKQNIALARKLGVAGVPGFVITQTNIQNERSVKGISLIRGAQPFSAFQKEIDKALASLQ